MCHIYIGKNRSILFASGDKGNWLFEAYPDSEGDAVIETEVTTDPPAIAITFRDSGEPYDPLAKEDPDITLSAEKRRIGGLGIFLVKKLMDEVAYKYEDGQNVLTIIKLLDK